MVRDAAMTQLALFGRISSTFSSQRAVLMACLLSIRYVYLCIFNLELQMYYFPRFLVTRTDCKENTLYKTICLIIILVTVYYPLYA